MLVLPNRVAPVCWPPPAVAPLQPVWLDAVAYATLRVAGLAVSMALWLLLLGLAVTVPLLF